MDSFCELEEELSTVPAFKAVAFTVICPVASQLDALVPVTVYTIDEFGVEITEAPDVVFKAVEGVQA